jgi:hypothetical protein
LPLAAIHSTCLRASKSKYLFQNLLLLVITKISNWCGIRAASRWNFPKVRFRDLDVQDWSQYKQTGCTNWCKLGNARFPLQLYPYY